MTEMHAVAEEKETYEQEPEQEQANHNLTFDELRSLQSKDDSSKGKETKKKLELDFVKNLLRDLRL